MRRWACHCALAVLILTALICWQVGRYAPDARGSSYPPCTTREGHLRDKVDRVVLPRPKEDVVSPRVLLLAQVIHAEAQGEPFTGKVAVGAVVMNRVRDPRYPDTIQAVVEAPGQFAVSRGARPGPECIEAARAALAGEDPTRGALYFYNPQTARCSWIRTRPVTVEIGQHRFTR